MKKLLFYVFSVFSHKMFTFPWLFSLFIIISFLNWKILSHVLWWILFAVFANSSSLFAILVSIIWIRREKKWLWIFSPNSDSHHSGEICVMSMLLMFRVCHNSQYNSYQSCFLVKTKISSNCPAMFHVIIVWSHYLPIFVRHTAYNQERDIRNQCILLSIWLLKHRFGSTIILLHHRHRSLSIRQGVNLVVVLALWNYYCESAAGAHSLSADYLMCSQTFSMRRSWWSSFALTPTCCDIRRADEHWCGERQDVPSMDSAGSTVRKTELICLL